LQLDREYATEKINAGDLKDTFRERGYEFF
jgi:hypothetical protein